MGQTPFPSLAELKMMAYDEETLDRFLWGLMLNPPRQSPWSRWRTRHLRKRLLGQLSQHVSRQD